MRGCACHVRGILFAAVACAALLAATGCGPVPNRLYVETFPDGATPQRYRTDFAESWFARAPDGGFDILLRSNQPSELDPRQHTEQIIHAHAFWAPVLGTTRAEPSMINATLRFIILTPPTGVGYGGAGFLTFKIDSKGETLEGTIESGELVPKQVAGGARQPFGPARVSGRIVATENRRQVLRLLHEAERQLQAAAPASPLGPAGRADRE